MKNADNVHWGVRKAIHEHAHEKVDDAESGGSDPLDFDAVMAQRLARIKMVQQEKDEAERQRRASVAREKAAAAAAAQLELERKAAAAKATTDEAAAKAAADTQKAYDARMAAVEAHRASMDRDQWDVLPDYHGTIQGDTFDNEDGFGFDFGADEEI